MKPFKSYDKSLIKSLKDPVEAAAYLNAALRERNPKLFLTAYYNVARAHGINRLAGRAKIHRVSLNKIFSVRGNPEWNSLLRILAASRLRFRVEAIRA